MQNPLQSQHSGGVCVSVFSEMLQLAFINRNSDNTPTLSKMQIGHAVSDLLTGADDSSWKPGKLHFCLFWTNYRTLLKVERRDFYEINDKEQLVSKSTGTPD